MRTAVLEAAKNFKLKDVAIPEPAANEVLIKVASCGVCHSEMGLWDGSFGEYPNRIGHEVSGTIEKVGSDICDLEVGQRVTIYADKHGYSDYVTAVEDCVIPIGDNVSFDEALGEPIGCVVNGLRRSGIQLGDTVVLVGVGFMGLIMLQLVRSQGAAKVIAIDTQDHALERAKELGADLCINPIKQDAKEIVLAETNDSGADVVIELTGNQRGLDLATELPRVRGRLVIFGFHVGERTVNMFLWNWRGLDVVNAHERDPKAYTDGIRIGMKLLEAGEVNMKPLVTHSFSLEQMNEAFAKAYRKDDDYVKAVVKP